MKVPPLDQDSVRKILIHYSKTERPSKWKNAKLVCKNWKKMFEDLQDQVIWTPPRVISMCPDDYKTEDDRTFTMTREPKGGRYSWMVIDPRTRHFSVRVGTNNGVYMGLYVPEDGKPIDVSQMNNGQKWADWKKCFRGSAFFLGLYSLAVYVYIPEYNMIFTDEEMRPSGKDRSNLDVECVIERTKFMLNTGQQHNFHFNDKPLKEGDIYYFVIGMSTENNTITFIPN